MAQDYSDITGGRRIPTQIPLNVKEWVKDEATLAYLGVDNNLAFTYHDNIEVFCLSEKTLYRWREVEVGEENSGLIPLDFTYPIDLPEIYGIDYSGKTYNFFLVNYVELEDIINVVGDNVGIGEGLFKGESILGNEKTLEFKSLVSDTLTITQETNDLRLEVISTSDTLQFIVNSDYVGDDELGTEQKPFKTTQNALDAYQGNGVNNKDCQFVGYQISIKKDDNLFTGSLLYKSLKLKIFSGATLACTPAAGLKIIDFDSDATLPIGMVAYTDTEIDGINIDIEDGGILLIEDKHGFKNRGTTYNDFISKGKYIAFNGNGLILINSDPNVATPSTRTIFEANKENLAGYFNGGNVANFYVNCKVMSANSQILYAGLNSKIFFEFGQNSIIRFNDAISDINSQTKPIVIDGGKLYCKKIQLECNMDTDSTRIEDFIFMKNNGNVELLDCNALGNITNLLTNNGVTNPTVNITSLNSTLDIDNKIFKSDSILWTNVKVDFSKINGILDSDDVELIPGSLNVFNNKVTETLPTYASKSAAVADGLSLGSAFIKFLAVDADDLIAGLEYKVTTFGDGGLGALGTYFTATGSETGTAVATLYTRETII